MKAEPVLRRATAADSDTLFKWVNQPDSLTAKALTTKPISRYDHDKWFSARLEDPETVIQIIELNGKMAGQVRLQRDCSGAYTVDIYVDFDFRGRGIAAWSVNHAVIKLSEVRPELRVIALVRIENASSATLFQRAEFAEIERSDEFITFERVISI